MKNTIGSNLAVTLFGESHGNAVGVVIDGIASGIDVDSDFIAQCLERRKQKTLYQPRVVKKTIL